MQHIRNWALLGLIALGMGVHAANPGDKAEAVNMRLVGYSDLQARTAYQPTIQKQGQRWIAYVGHHGDFKLNPLTGQMEDNGTSILDVTDPKKPQYLAHLPGGKGKAEQGGAQQEHAAGESGRGDAERVGELLLGEPDQLAHRRHWRVRSRRE